MRRITRVGKSAFLKSGFILLTAFSVLIGYNAAETEARTVDEVICRNCDAAWAGNYNATGSVLYLSQWHKIDGSCGGSGVANLAPDKSAVVVPVQYDELPFDVVLESEGNCSRCGGESVCHTQWQAGGCHIACGPGGGEVMFEVTDKLNALVQIADASGITDLVRDTPDLVFNSTRRSLILMGCNNSPIEVYPLEAELFRRVESSLLTNGE